MAASDHPESPARRAGPAVAEVLVPTGLDQTYSYSVPTGLDLAPGDVVAVPFGPREWQGVVWELRDQPAGGASNLPRVARRVDSPPLAAPLRCVVECVAR